MIVGGLKIPRASRPCEFESHHRHHYKNSVLAENAKTQFLLLLSICSVLYNPCTTFCKVNACLEKQTMLHQNKKGRAVKTLPV
jgi:hypothetical protein